MAKADQPRECAQVSFLIENEPHSYFKLHINKAFKCLGVIAMSIFYHFSDLHVKNMAYLSSAQALADIANFRIKISQQMGFKDNKWIVFGGSYPGSLAAWFGLKYPHLISGAIASSAPLVSKVNFKGI